MQHFTHAGRVTSVSLTDAEVYQKHKDELMRFATALVGPNDAGDMLSNVVTRILGAGRSLTDFREPRPYLMRAVLNESRSLHRARRTPPTVAEAPTDPTDRVRPDVLAAVLELPVRQRAVTYLVYWAGMTSEEVGSLLGARPATVRRYLYLARQKLKEALDE